MLSAKSISYADPAKGGLSGVVAGKAIERLGIAEQMKAKTTLVPGAQSPELVAKGEVELGIAQASEIVPIAGVQLVGPLPGELGSLTLFTGGVGAESGIGGCGEGADRVSVRARGRRRTSSQRDSSRRPEAPDLKSAFRFGRGRAECAGAAACQPKPVIPTCSLLKLTSPGARRP